MKFIDRKLVLFPAIALTASAQQPSPEAAAAEAALRARARQFFDLQAAKNYRPAEALVATDSKDDYYNGYRYSFKSYAFQKVELLDNNTRARIIIKARVVMMAAGFPPMEIDTVLPSLWKIEAGQWVWYVDKSSTIDSPFGPIKKSQDGGGDTPLPAPVTIPDPKALQASVKVDRNSVALTPDGPVQTVTVSNELPGPVDLQLSTPRIDGLSVEMEKKHLDAGEKAAIRFQAARQGKGSGTAHVVVSPIGTQLDIRVTVN